MTRGSKPTKQTVGRDIMALGHHHYPTTSGGQSANTTACHSFGIERLYCKLSIVRVWVRAIKIKIYFFGISIVVAESIDCTLVLLSPVRFLTPPGKM